MPSRRILQDTSDSAAAVGATAVVVHSGHMGDHLAALAWLRKHLADIAWLRDHLADLAWLRDHVVPAVGSGAAAG